jgi:hypothetical protein
VAYGNGGESREGSAHALCMTLRHDRYHYLWAQAREFSPEGVHTSRGDNVERPIHRLCPHSQRPLCHERLPCLAGISHPSQLRLARGQELVGLFQSQDSFFPKERGFFQQQRELLPPLFSLSPRFLRVGPERLTP